MDIVYIACPRCCGHGHSPLWRPDGGLCYRCKGVGEVRVDIHRLEAALRYLRAKYVHLRTAARAGNTLAAEFLEMCVADGHRVAGDLAKARAIAKAGPV